MTDEQIEQEIQEKDLNAPRVTPQQIEDCIKSEHYFRASQAAAAASHGVNFPLHENDYPELGVLTFCVLILKNGFTVTGESACASPENFDAEIGQKIARENAKQKIWALEGYLLKQRLFESIP